MRRSALQGFMFNIGGAQYCDEALLIFNRLTGEQPSTALKQLINEVISYNKEDGTHPLADCYYIRGVHTAELACQNWAKNAHNSTLVNSPVFTAKAGIQGNGTTSYIDNNYTQSTGAVNYLNISSSIVAMFNTIGTVNAKSLLGVLQGGGTKWNMVFFYTGANEKTYLNDAVGIQTINATNGAYLGWTKIGTTVQGYLDGVSTGAGITSNNREPNSISLYELAINADGIVSYLSNGKISFSFYGGYLDPTKMLALKNRIQYFYANVGGTF